MTSFCPFMLVSLGPIGPEFFTGLLCSTYPELLLLVVHIFLFFCLHAIEKILPSLPSGIDCCVDESMTV